MEGQMADGFGGGEGFGGGDEGGGSAGAVDVVAAVEDGAWRVDSCGGGGGGDDAIL